MSKKVLAVFNPHTLERIGLITKYTSVLFAKKSKDAGSFELWCDLDNNNVEMVKDGNLIYLSDDKVGIVQYIEEQVDDDGIKSLNVKGKMIKYYMSYRIIIGTYEAFNKCVSDVMNELVQKNFINPVDGYRTFEHMSIASDSQVGVGPQITVQKTGGEVMEELDVLANSYSFCYDVLLNPNESKLEFKAYQGVDRTVNQSDVIPVVISTDLKDILNSKYIRNSQSEKNVALVAGAGEGSARRTLMVGTMASSGVDRKEMYVDARDLSTTSEDEDGNTTTLSDEEYDLLLQNRGETKISEQKIIESFDAEVRTTGHVNCVYGVDYFLGDTVTAIDKKLGVMVDAEVTEVEEVYAGTDGYSLKVTFGYGQPTIMDKIKAIDKEAKTLTSTSAVAQDIQDANDKVEEVVKQMDGMLNLVYPIGAIYMSVVSTSPALLFGGTWERIQDKFLLCAGSSYAAGATGGESTHTLTTNEMPSHTHTQNSHNHTQNAHTHTQKSHNHTQNGHTHNTGKNDYVFQIIQRLSTNAIARRRVSVPSSGNYYTLTTDISKSDSKGTSDIDAIGSVSTTIPTNNATTATNQNTTATNNATTATNQNTGGGAAHNNMPPYLSVYVWKRTA